MLQWLRSLRSAGKRRPAEIPDGLWRDTLASFPFLARHGALSLAALRKMTREFLDQKEFHGTGNLQVTDQMAVAIAAQACLPVLHIAAPCRGLAWYQDFVGIVVHAGAVRAKRERMDDAGVIHAYEEVLTGEAMQDGPVTLSWQDVKEAGRSAHSGYNVVIHEFVHKIDMCGGVPDGCPPLAAGFMGHTSAALARQGWRRTLNAAYLGFCDQLSMAERFGGAVPWLDPYAAHAIDEFFAVVSEAYFVNPGFFARDFPALVPMFDAFFSPAPD